MKNRKKLSKNRYIKNIYQQVVSLALLMHIMYFVIFYYFSFDILTIYNIFSVIFYGIILMMINKGYFKSAVSLIHLEAMVFVCSTIYMLGWQTGFALYILAMISLIYFWPFKNQRWAYGCALLEIIVFIAIKIISSMQNEVLYVINDEKIILILSIFNAVCSFIVMIYSSYVSGVSLDTIYKINDDLMEIADNDQLTGLRNRHYLLELLQMSENQECIIAISDIDNFKIINDTNGHLCGDHILCSLADLMKDSLPDDINICRWGGEEFIFLSFDKSKEEFVEIVNNFMNVLKEHTFVYRDKKIKITMTFGISEAMDAKNLDAMIKCADDRLYIGKGLGKNQIVIEDNKKGGKN